MPEDLQCTITAGNLVLPHVSAATLALCIAAHLLIFKTMKLEHGFRSKALYICYRDSIIRDVCTPLPLDSRGDQCRHRPKHQASAGKHTLIPSGGMKRAEPTKATKEPQPERQMGRSSFHTSEVSRYNWKGLPITSHLADKRHSYRDADWHDVRLEGKRFWDLSSNESCCLPSGRLLQSQRSAIFLISFGV